MYGMHCEGCGEYYWECWCNEECPYCDKKLIKCTSDSDIGKCPNEERLKAFW